MTENELPILMGRPERLAHIKTRAQFDRMLDASRDAQTAREPRQARPEKPSAVSEPATAKSQPTAPASASNAPAHDARANGQEEAGDWIGPAEAVAILGCVPTHMSVLARRGHITAKRAPPGVGSGRALLYLRSSVEAWRDKRAAEGMPTGFKQQQQASATAAGATTTTTAQPPSSMETLAESTPPQVTVSVNCTVSDLDRDCAKEDMNRMRSADETAEAIAAEFSRFKKRIRLLVDIVDERLMGAEEALAKIGVLAGSL